jgi:pimeloyl-ACP methyl ester carboxylesterase
MTKLVVLLTTASVALLAACTGTQNSAPSPTSALTPIAGLSCSTPPPLHCPDENCPGELVIAAGDVLDPGTDRKFFLDYPCDWQPGEQLTFVLSLHGGGSYGNWQRHYFPIMDYVNKYRLVVATPNAPPRVWRETDDQHLQNIVDMVYGHFGEDNIKAFWLAGHSQGGMTSRRIVCSDYFNDKVDGFLSLSGGRVGGGTTRPEGGFGIPRPGGATGEGGDSATARAQAAESRPQPQQTPPLPACEFSHIFTTGEYEMGGPISADSPWAEKYSCDGKQKVADIYDTKAGYVYDSGRIEIGSKAWGLLPDGGSAEVFTYPNCNAGMVVADVVRVDKGHTEGLEPNVTQTLIELMLGASSTKN